MHNGGKWAIKKSDGQLLQSFAIDSAQISITWLRPDASGKSKEGKKGPFTFQSMSKAQALLTALAVLLPNEFLDGTLANIEETPAADDKPSR